MHHEKSIWDKIIHVKNLRSFAYCNNQICKNPIKGFTISFFGLDGATMFTGDTEDGIRFAEDGILYVLPFSL